MGVWDGVKHSDTVEQLTCNPITHLGSQGGHYLEIYESAVSYDVSVSVVRSWSGGVNSIDASSLAATGDQRREWGKDSWDQELDRGKVSS